MEYTIYTIGYGNRKIEDFTSLLIQYRIEYLIDVRSQPYSKHNPQFNQQSLLSFLKQNKVTYVFMGDTLGGRPTDAECYDNIGKVNYEIIKAKDFFLSGIKRIETAYYKKIPIALMCSEAKPIECHRSKLIGRFLLEKKIILSHIDENNIIKDQFTVINELNKGKADSDLFGESKNITSRKSYLK